MNETQIRSRKMDCMLLFQSGGRKYSSTEVLKRLLETSRTLLLKLDLFGILSKIF
jgi:biotin operon repressor